MNRERTVTTFTLYFWPALVVLSVVVVAWVAAGIFSADGHNGSHPKPLSCSPSLSCPKQDVNLACNFPEIPACPSCPDLNSVYSPSINLTTHTILPYRIPEGYVDYSNPDSIIDLNYYGSSNEPVLFSGYTLLAMKNTRPLIVGCFYRPTALYAMRNMKGGCMTTTNIAGAGEGDCVNCVVCGEPITQPIAISESIANIAGPRTFYLCSFWCHQIFLDGIENDNTLPKNLQTVAVIEEIGGD